MKKFFVCFLLIFSLTQACKAQNTLLEILEVVAEGIGAYNNAYNASRPMLKDLGSVVLDVNSASNQFWYGGHTRNYCEVPLPEGTIRWFYRATVMSIESNYNYQSNETLFYLLQNHNIFQYHPLLL
jgi:hypothetical protein